MWHSARAGLVLQITPTRKKGLLISKISRKNKKAAPIENTCFFEVLHHSMMEDCTIQGWTKFRALLDKISYLCKQEWELAKNCPLWQGKSPESVDTSGFAGLAKHTPTKLNTVA